MPTTASRIWKDIDIKNVTNGISGNIGFPVYLKKKNKKKTKKIKK